MAKVSQKSTEEYRQQKIQTSAPGKVDLGNLVASSEAEMENANSLKPILEGQAAEAEQRTQSPFSYLQDAFSSGLANLFGTQQNEPVATYGVDSVFGEPASSDVSTVPNIASSFRSKLGANAAVSSPATTASGLNGAVAPKLAPNVTTEQDAGSPSGVVASDIVDSALADNSLTMSPQDADVVQETGSKVKSFRRSDSGNKAKPRMMGAILDGPNKGDTLDETDNRAAFDTFSKKTAKERTRQARRYNKSIERKFEKAQESDPGLTWERFVKDNPLDQEAFQDELAPVMRNAYRTLGNYSAVRELADESLDTDIEEAMEQGGAGSKFRENFKLWRLLDRTTWDMRMGFFPVKSQRLEFDDNTKQYEPRWSKQVEDAIVQLMEDFGQSGIDGQKTVFRCVRLYATMAIDHQGKMFGENQDEWSLTDREFVSICRCMHQSIELYGHPFVAPFVLSGSFRARTSLRGTDIFPSGVIPRVVAEAITGEDSKVIFKSGPKKGDQMTADELIDAARQEFLDRTQPKMEAVLTEENSNDKHNLVAQKVACYSAMQAFARLDGLDAESFGERYNIDAAQHYRLEEYADQCAEYAQVTHGQYDATAVNDRLAKKLQKTEQENIKGRKKKVGAVEASANLFTSGAKANAVVNPGIAISAVLERGVGNLLTFGSLKILNSKNMPGAIYVDGFDVPQSMMDSMKADPDEWLSALDAAYMLLDVGGPGNVAGFAQTGQPMTVENVSAYLKENVLRPAANTRAEKIMELEAKFQKISQKLLRGDHAFRKSTMGNFLRGLMVANMAVAHQRAQLSNDGKVDTYAGICLNGDEMADVFKAHNGDVASFLTEIMATTAGKDALQIMNVNNIGQFNYFSHWVNRKFAENGIGEAAVAVFVDKFATYGINFLYTMIPMSRTFTYLGLKQKEASGDITIADFAIGGSVGEGGFSTTNENTVGLKFEGGPGFWDGLKMNLVFDCVTLGRNVLTSVLIGAVFAALGFDLPDDDERDKKNASMYKIGGNVGWGPDTDGDGKGDGIEWMPVFWLNDLTQWGLPGAYAFAACLTGHQDRAADLLMDSLYDQCEGNVVLDFLDLFKTLNEDVIDIDRAMKDPTYTPKFNLGNAALSVALRTFDMITPLAPLTKSVAKSALIWGDEADAYAPSKKFDKSSDWAKSIDKSDYIDDDRERIIRQHSAENLLLAAIMNGAQMITAGEDLDETTGYAWWQMPIKSQQAPMSFVWAEMQEINYDEKPEGMTNAEYEYMRAMEFIQYIEDNFETPQDAIEQGFFITPDMQKACRNVIFSEINFAENELASRSEIQDFSSEDKFYNDRAYYRAFVKRYENLYYDYFAPNSNIPSWMGTYGEIKSNYEKMYSFDDGSPATGADYAKSLALAWTGLAQHVNVEYYLKGDHPTTLAPWMVVDYNTTEKMNRGWSGETKPAYETVEGIKLLEDEVIPKGKHEGETVGDVYFGEVQENGERLHEGSPTVGSRALYPLTYENEYEPFGREDADGSIYGYMGQAGGTTSNPNGAASTSGSKESEKTPYQQKYDEDSRPPYDTDWAPAPGIMGPLVTIPDRERAKEAANGSALTYAGEIMGAAIKGLGRLLLDPLVDNDEDANGATQYPKTWYPYSFYGYGTKSNSGNYSPRIYSTTRNVNGDRAATMYTKTPGDARTSYLNPRFNTKGSREAYERQDF